MTVQTPPQFDLGDRVTVLGIFKTPPSFLGEGDYTDPAEVFFKFTGPDGTPTIWKYGVNAEVVREAIGHYHACIDADVAGWWRWKFYSTGLKKAAKKGSFRVLADDF